MSKRIIRVIIIDDQRLMREGLVSLLKADGGFEVVGDYASGPEAFEKISLLSPDVAIVDIQIPGLDGISIGRRLRQQSPVTELVYLTSVHSDDQAREAFGAGGRCYLLKDCSFDELALATRKAADGDYYLTGPSSSEMIAEYIKPLLDSEKPGGRVTVREKEIARLLADGYSTKEAADVLNISVKTAEAHRASIMKKLKAKNVTDIVKYCIRNQIIET
jgi:DNA-binding NarL/FixJ family response regulator